MKNILPPPDMNVEETFNEFVEDFGGELIANLFTGKGEKPKNADYFLRERTVVAELKCLEKNYVDDRKIGDKFNAMVNQWAKEGRLVLAHIKAGRFETDDLPPKCAFEVFKLFSGPIRIAIEKANKQIKETKKYFGLPEAKGLFIIANDGNYSIGPKLMMQILGNLLKSRYTGIDSFIYFTPNMRCFSPGIDTQFNIWISGRARQSSKSVEPEFLNKIYKGWVSFMERKTGERISVIEADDHEVIENMKLVRP